MRGRRLLRGDIIAKLILAMEKLEKEKSRRFQQSCPGAGEGWMQKIDRFCEAHNPTQPTG
jgi:hypothetical protein